MADSQLKGVLQFVRKLAGPGALEDLTDGQLLERFVGQADEAAFTTLVHRHGPVILGVCKRVLANEADAADAFQAVFLVLARRAATIRKKESVGSWLYGVAYRIARKAKIAAVRRRAHERQVVTMPRSDPLAAVMWRDLRPVLDEELGRLAEKYRAPLILCYLHGKSHDEAARQLGWPNGTVCGRLARARDLLRHRLARRGLALSAGLLPTVLAQNAVAAVPGALVSQAVAVALISVAGPAAAGAISAHVLALADGALTTSAVTKLSATASLLFGLVFLGTAGGALLSRTDSRESGGGDLPRGTLISSPVHRLSCERPVLATTISPDGRMLAAGDSDSRVHLWDLATGREQGSLRLHQGEVSALAFSPNGQLLASAGYDGAIRLLAPVTGDSLRQIRAHPGVISSLAFTPDGTTLVSAGWDGTIRLWEMSTGHEIRTLTGHRGRIWSVAVSPDGKTLASGGADKTIRLWDPVSGNERRQVGQHRSGIFSVAFSPDGAVLAASESNRIRLWDVGAEQEVGSVVGHETAVVYFAFSPDGRTLAWTDDDDRIHIRELATGGERLELSGHQKTISCLTFSKDGRWLVSGSADTTARVWDLARPGSPVTGNLEGAWKELASTDAARAYQAICSLAAVPDSTVPFIKDRLIGGADANLRTNGLISNLDDDAFNVREQATGALIALGEAARPAISRALAAQPSPEARRRLDRVLQEMDRGGPGGSTPLVQGLRALEVLERAATPASRQLLESLAATAPATRLNKEAKAALDRLTERQRGVP
jgi:RNA polymerase sigma factor (sigma-70 family)